KWYRKAAEQGDAMAQSNLGFCYSSGNGVTKNYKEAYKWFVIAGAHERTSLIASSALEDLEDKMTFDQITEAEEEAAEFSPSGD
ncbi:MAG: sel1 repeat family protein, partial [Verrucomicrobiales bacterium]